MANDTSANAEKAYEYYNMAASALSSGSLTGSKTTEQRRSDGEIVDYENRSVRLAADGGLAEVVVNPSDIILAVSQNTAIGISDNSIVLDGRVSFTNMPDDIIIGGFWRFNEELLTTLPSTLFNPIETLIFKYPPFVKKVAKIFQLLG